MLIERSIATLESYLASSTPIAEEILETTEAESIARKGEETNKETSDDEHADSNSTTD